MADRGWLGFSRRWWASRQVQADPLEVVSVGYDESDAGSLDVMGGSVAAGGAGQFSAATLSTVGVDVFVEAMLLRMGGGQQTIALSLNQQTTAPPPGGNVSARYPQGPAFLEVVAGFIGALATEPRIPLGDPGNANQPLWVHFGRTPGLTIQNGRFLRVVMTQDNQPLEIAFFLRPAA